jgi:RNA recognition motif-containing protein
MNFISDLWRSLSRVFTGGGSAEGDGAGGHRLYVGNLSYRVKEEELRGLFSKYGRIKTLHLIRDRLTRRLKGYAFLEMSPDDANKALVLNGVDFLGRKLVVSIAKAKTPGRSETTARPERSSSSRRPTRWKKNRSGPKVYGNPNKDSDTPVQRYE